MKAMLNRTANRFFQRLGYTSAMTADAKREAWWWLRARAAAAAGRRGLLKGSAVVWADVGRAELIPIEVPVARIGEVTIAVSHSVVSPGTERAQYLRLPNARVDYPHQPGYSAAGEVVAVGRGVKGLQVGNRVAARGVRHASVATIPATRVVPVPDEVLLEDAALLQLGIICGHGVHTAAIGKGEPFCVVGAGLIGVLTQRLATAAGAGPATLIAKSRAKEEVARAGGTARFLDLSGDDREIDELQANVVIEATGDPAALHVAVRAAAPGGRIVLLGSPRGATTDVPLETIREKQLTLIGAHVELLTREVDASGGDGYSRESRRFMELLAEGSLDVRDLVATTADPREADAFYRELATNRALLGARFDWTLLATEPPLKRSSLLRVPDVRARGIDDSKHLLGSGAGFSQSSPLHLDDPFADAVGHLRIGLLGCGDIATHNATGIAVAPNAELTACYDPVAALAEEIARDHGAEVASTAESLLARRDVDCVFLSVPHHLHAPLALQAIQAGKHVIVEKPLSNSLASGLEMVRAAESAGVALTVCFPHRYGANVVAARRLIAAGALGEVAGVLISMFSDKPASYWLGGFSGRSSSNWRGSKEHAGGGFLIMNLSHLLDLIEHLTGLEAEHCSAFANAVDGPSEVEDTISLSIGYGNGAVGSVFGSSALRGNRASKTELHLWGPDGHLTIEPDPKLYTLRAIDGLQPSRWCSLRELTGPDIRGIFVSRFASAIARDEPADVRPDQALRVQALIEAAYASAETGSTVSPKELLSEVGV